MNAPVRHTPGALRPLILDSFAGGGGASEGIRAALGRDPDYALNHDRLALAMHRINHPGTHHVEEDVWNVDAVGLCRGRPIGLLWMSPDCKHFSKAKGGKPREKAIRGLAWVGIRWIKSLPKAQRPRVVFLENVEEFQDWGPLLDDGKPCPLQRGATFKSFVKAFEAMGYAVEWRELRACDYGAPTIRKRLFLVARRDGRPIVWPEPTHGDPKSEAVLAGRLLPWRTAAEIIDWSLPCPSIFETSAEIKAKHGIRANRPLADATMARIAKGTMRYVVNAAKPFLVQVNHGGGAGGRAHDVGEPHPTLTGGRGEALVQPFVTYGQQGGGNRDAGDPLHTITASPKDQNAIVTPFVTKFNRGATGHEIDRPLATVTSHHSETHGGGAAPLGVVAPHLIRVDQTSGDAARKGVHAADEPVSTITTAGAQALIGACLVPRYGERPGQDPRARAVDEPAPVIVPTGNEGSLAAVHLTRQFGASVGSGAEEPVGTITAGGAGKAGVVAAFLAQHNLGVVGHEAEEPISTISQKGAQQQVVAAHLLNLRGSDRRDGPVDAPAPTVSAQGNHAAVIAVELNQIGDAFDADRIGDGLEGRRDGDDPRRLGRNGLAGSRGEQRQARPDHPAAGRVSSEERLSRGSGSVGGPTALRPGPSTGLDGVEGANPARDGRQSPQRGEGQQRTGEPGTREQVGQPQARLQDGPQDGAAADTGTGPRRRQQRGEGASVSGLELLADREAARDLSDDSISRGQRVAAFLQHYYGTGGQDQRCDHPLHTVTAKPRHGVVTVLVQGQPYAIVDIGMRMLTPRERFRAQGFRADYVIDRGELEDGTIVPLTLEAQGRMCGNSVCPQMAEALVAANYREEVARRPAREAAPVPLFAAE